MNNLSRSILGILIAVSFLVSCKNKSVDNNGKCFYGNQSVESLVEKQLLTGDYSVDYHYTVSIPPDYTISEEGAEDFVVYYIFHVDTILESYFAGGIYFGNHPNTFEYCENDNDEIKIVKNKIFGKNVKFTIYNCDMKYSTQSITKSGSKEHWCKYIHMFGGATSEPELEKLFEVFQTLSKSKK